MLARDDKFVIDSEGCQQNWKAAGGNYFPWQLRRHDAIEKIGRQLAKVLDIEGVDTAASCLARGVDMKGVIHAATSQSLRRAFPDDLAVLRRP